LQSLSQFNQQTITVSRPIFAPLFKFHDIGADQPVTTSQCNVYRSRGGALRAAVDIGNGMDKSIEVHLSPPAMSRLKSPSRDANPLAAVSS
jgi:hypothetical protein